MDAFIVAWCLWLLAMWYYRVKVLPEQRAITECKHPSGELIEAVPDRRGRATALVWRCKHCPLQIPLQLHRIPGTLDRLPGTVWWFPSKEDNPK